MVAGSPLVGMVLTAFTAVKRDRMKIEIVYLLDNRCSMLTQNFRGRF